MSKQQGFTLVELTIVIVILGILSATAIPKYINLSGDAKSAVLKTVSGSLKSSSSMVHMKAVIDDKMSGEEMITVDGMDILLHSGYPQGLWKYGIAEMLQLNIGDGVSNIADVCEDEWCGLDEIGRIPSGLSAKSSGKIMKIFPKGYAYKDECGVYYLNNADGLSPEIGTETKDCK